MTIWIVRKHPRHPLWDANIEAFTIVSTHATRAEAAAEASGRNKRRATRVLYTVGKVTLKELSQ